MTAPTIAKNTFYLTAAMIGQKIFSFIYFTLLARSLGVEQIGLYVTILSFTSIFLILVDLGVTPVLIREGARDKEKMSEIFSQIFSAKLIFGLLTYGLLNLVIFFIRGHYTNPGQFQVLIAVMGVMMIINSLVTTFYGALRSFQNLKYEAIGVIGGQIITVIFGLLVLWYFKSLPLLFVALGSGDIFGIILANYFLSKRFQVRLRLLWNKTLFKQIALTAFPFALAGIFTKVYSYIDHVLLSYLINIKEVGFYSIPNKIVFSFQFIPLAFAASLYPAMSALFVHDRTRLKIIFEKGLFYLAMMVLPISFGLVVIADIFVIKVYGVAFQTSILPLKILAASLIFAFLDFPIGSLLNACNLQRIQTTAMGITMVFNIILNLFLIPKLGVVGAAISALISNSVLFLFGFLYVPKIVSYPAWSFWIKIGKIFISAAGMFGIVFILKQQLLRLFLPTGFIHSLIFLSLLIICGGVFYFAFLWIFKILKKEEFKDLLGIIKR